MATPWNAVLKKFVSALFHPAAEAVDAWALDWNRWTDVYLSPLPHRRCRRCWRTSAYFRGSSL